LVSMGRLGAINEALFAGGENIAPLIREQLPGPRPWASSACCTPVAPIKSLLATRRWTAVPGAHRTLAGSPSTHLRRGESGPTHRRRCRNRDAERLLSPIYAERARGWLATGTDRQVPAGVRLTALPVLC
jgi:hypothetical protein